MKRAVPELLFTTREDFRRWLAGNAHMSEGVWLVFGKTKAIVTLTANEALEEALCFGWIDGQIQSIDDAKYVKYFAKRRTKSVWSDKNKQIVEKLRKQSRMTPHGEAAIAEAIENGSWATTQRLEITDEQVAALTDKLRGLSPAFENFMGMPPSVKRTYTRAYLAPKSEEAKQRGFERIVGRLNQNLKPM